MSGDTLTATLVSLTELGWRGEGPKDCEEALSALSSGIKARNHLSYDEAEALAGRLMDYPASKRRQALFSFWTFHNGSVKEPVRLISDIPEFTFFTQPHSCGSDVFLCCDAVPVCQIRVFSSEEEMREGFTKFSIRKQEAMCDAFGFIQVRVFTCGNETLYFSNDRDKRQEAAYVWTDAANEVLSDFDTFSDAFLRPAFFRDFIHHSILVRKGTGEDASPIILRPYQYHACQMMLNSVKAYAAEGGETPRGYVWHSTGSGKTITMISTAIRILNETDFEKVIIIVDRLDLDEQTTKVLSAFLGPIKVLRTQAQLRRKLREKPRGESLASRVLVTTIGKMATNARGDAKQGKFVFMFDECHRSQDGKNNTSITASYPDSPIFGFTGTPIHLIGAKSGKRTTDNIFRTCIHKYLIKHACRDNNILPFNIIYKAGSQDGKTTEVFFNDPENIRAIARYIVEHNDELTENRRFASIVTFSSVAGIGMFYDALKAEIEAQGSPLRAALSVSSSFRKRDEDEAGGDDEYDFEDDDLDGPDEEELTEDAPETADEKDADPDAGYPAAEPVLTESSADLMNRVVNDYARERDLTPEETYALKQSTFRGYRKEIAKKIQRNEKGAVDILLVVGQFITGFDAPRVNTVYVMRKTDMHSLIQTISRANRTFGEGKTCGNAVFFQEAKTEVNKALRAYNDEDISSLNRFVIRPPYAELVSLLNASLPVVQDHEMVPLWSEEEVAKLKTALSDCATGLRMFPTYPQHRDTDLVVAPQAARSLLARARERLKPTKPPEAGADYEIIDSVVRQDVILFDHIRLSNGASVLSMKDYEQQLEAIDFQADRNDSGSRRALEGAMTGLRPRAEGDDSEDTLLTVRQMEEVFNERVQLARDKMTAYYAEIYGIDPEPAQKLIRTIFAERLHIVNREMMTVAGFPTDLENFFVQRRAFQKVRDLVIDRFPPL